MPFDQETLAKLTTALASDVELYNRVVNEVQSNDTAITERDNTIKDINSKLEESDKRGQQYLGQISNLLSKIPVGNSSPSKSQEQRIEEVKNRAWTK